MIKARSAGVGRFLLICKNMEKLKGRRVLFVVPTIILTWGVMSESVTVNKSSE